MAKYYPAFRGRNKAKMQMFRLQKDKPVGDPSRYPIGMLFPFRVDVSFGKLSMTRSGALRINETEAIKKSFNKITTKEVWERAGIPHPGPSWRLSNYVRNGDFLVQEFEETENLNYPLVMKRTHGSGGKGFSMIRNYDELVVALGHVAPGDVPNYFFEPAFNMTREYRIHVSPHLSGKSITYTVDKPVKQSDGSWSSQREIITRNNGVIHEVRKKESERIDFNAYRPGTEFPCRGNHDTPITTPEVVNDVIAPDSGDGKHLVDLIHGCWIVSGTHGKRPVFPNYVCNKDNAQNNQ